MLVMEQWRRPERLVGWRPLAVALATLIVGASMFAFVGADNGEGDRVSRSARDCVQRVRDWSPSRQAQVTRVQSFCG